MKLLLFSDVHCNAEACRRLVERARGADVIIGAGDFGQQRRGLEPVIEILGAITCPAVLVPGNGESAEELRDACAAWPSARVLHGEGTSIEGVPFFGIGGGIPVTPFGAWSYDFTEEEASTLLADCPANAVLVTHSPPHGVVDADAGEDHRGSTAVRSVVEALAPRLVVCGHIHSCWEQQDHIGSTPVVNAGPRGVEWEITNAVESSK